MSNKPIFVLGTGRCGFESITNILSDHVDILKRFRNRENNLLPWDHPLFGRPHSYLDELFNTIHENDSRVAYVGSEMLPHVSYVKEKIPNAKFVVMHRDKESVINSFLRCGMGYSPTLNSLESKLLFGEFYQCFPHYEKNSATESLKEYYVQYETKVGKIEDAFHLNVEELNNDDKLNELFDYLEIDEPDGFPADRHLNKFEEPYDIVFNNYNYLNRSADRLNSEASFDQDRPDKIWGLEEKRHNDPKFSTIFDYDVNVWPHTGGAIDFDQKYPITVAYIIWSDPTYLKFAYLSILSQLIYTDIMDVNIVVLVDEELYKYAVKLFDGLHISVHSIDTTDYYYPEEFNFRIYRKLNKYVASTHPLLRSDDILLISDCDSFTYGKPTPVYKNIYDQYKANDELPVLMCRESTPDRSVFLERREHLASMMVDDDEYITWVCKRLGLDKDTFIDDFVYNDNWWLSCWIGFDNSKFKDVDWKKYSMWSEAYSMYCDESIYLTYAYEKEYQISDLSFIKGLRYVGVDSVDRSIDFWKRDDHDVLGVIHPLHGNNVTNFNIVNYYDHFQTKFKDKLEEAWDNKVKLRDVLDQYN